MKIQAALLSLGMVSAAFCVDEYQPIEKSKTEIDVGVTYIAQTGTYDHDSKKVDLPSGVSPALTGIPLQVKYGIMTGLDVELAWTYAMFNKDAGDMAGFQQPDLAVKYAFEGTGFAAYLDVVLPFVTGDFDVTPSGADLGIAPGIVYGKNFGQIQAVGLVSYQYNLENGDKVKNGDLLTVYLKPGYSVSDALAAYVGVKYQMEGEAAFDGTSVTDTDGNLLTLLPGVTFTQNKMLSYEVNVPITVMGKNAPNAFLNPPSWGVWASVYVTLP